MDDLPSFIDEYEPLIKDEFLNAVEETQNEIEQFISENYPADIEDLPDGSGIDEIIVSALETQLSKGFQVNLTALEDKVGLLVILLLGLSNFNINLPKSELIKIEIKQILDDCKKTFKIAGSNKKRILETIGLTPNQAKSLLIYRQELERIAKQKNTPAKLNINAIRNLSASQRSVVRKALANGIEPQDIDPLISKQHKAFLMHRAKAIGNTLSSKIAHATQQAAVNFAIKAKLVKPNQFKRFWVTAHDEKVRHAHNQTEAANSQGVDLNQPFITPFGLVFFPPLEINCRCYVSMRKV
ncbi:MAG: phage minor head protein [Methylococcaceae bacterium]|nr:phage minor head protein [Methylococcaceae bacterium]MDP3902609.1 phage minor head protein [Methylococcaceae bacterium]